MKKYPYLSDEKFLKELNKDRDKKQYAKIVLLDWNEKPIQNIVGAVTGGTLNVDGASAVRRTCNLNIYVPNTEVRITNINRIISIGRKVKIEIGFENKYDKYKDFDTIWFPIGLFVITNPNIQHSISGTNVSLQLKDKMCLLNGEVGGVLPAAVTFSEYEYLDDTGETKIGRPTIYQIIQELVNHWGGEQLGKIIISDIDKRIKKVMKWTGETPVYLFNEGNGYELTTDEDKILELESSNVKYEKFLSGQNIGYVYSDFYYPNGELVNSPGATITSILDTIKNTLGNFEYFYDLEGNFIFQEIKNYLNTAHSTVELDNLKQENYLVDYSKGKSVYNFDTGELVTTFNNTPQYTMIKNDFVVWGVRKTPLGLEIPIRYHLSIDEKPRIGQQHTVFKYEENDEVKYKSTLSLNNLNLKEGKPGIFYNVNGQVFIWDSNQQALKPVDFGELVTVTSTDWRTELFLQGVDASPYGLDSNYYYTELQQEWPKLYDIWGDSNQLNQPDFYENVKKTPSDIDFFLDIIDTSAAIGEFSVSNIGRRSVVISDNSINCIFPPKIPNWIMIENNKDNTIDLLNEASSKGQTYALVDSTIFEYLATGQNPNSAYEYVKDLLYKHTSYNESITIQSIPIYFLEPNTRITVKDIESNISGDYIINRFSIPLDINGTMSISATRALEKI